MATSLIFGEQEDIEIKHGDQFDGFTWTVLDSNGDTYTFPDGVADMDLKVYDYKGGTQVGDTQDDTDDLSRSSNVITWQAAYSDWDSGSVTVPGRTYYYELTIVTTTGSKHKTVAYGELIIK